MSVSLHINGQAIEAREGATLFELAEGAGIRVPTSCRKQGKCRECMMDVAEGAACLSPPVAQEAHLPDGMRLSCRTRIVSDSGTVRCETMRRGGVQVLTEAYRLPVTGANLPLEPAVTREGASVCIDGEPVAEHAGPIHGIAVDLGTTTVALRLVDLETGELVAVQSFENPQRFGGSDVMARIQYDSDHKGKLLRRVLAGYLSQAIEAFPADPRTVFEVVVAGNATLRDLFFGLPVQSIGQRPYRSITEQEMLDGKRETTALTATAQRAGLPIHPAARVVGLPLVSCHVGADAAACLLAIDLMNEERTVALMDIGTNTELLVGNRHRALAASCPAGPAFEGGELSCGMPGVAGAIERVAIGADGGVTVEVLGGGAPQGVCGSGLIDLLGELLRTGRMNALGRFANGDERFPISEPHGLSLTENDISLLAQAKGANVAGLRIVFDEFGIGFEDVEVFYLAGGFARHISVDAARRIGLIPDLPDGRIVQVGNASLEGATVALCSAPRRRALDRFVRGIRHVELETREDFFDCFVEGCQFVPVTSGIRGTAP